MVDGGVQPGTSDRVSLRESSVGRALFLDGGAGHQVSHTTFDSDQVGLQYGISITGDAENVVIRNNELRGLYSSGLRLGNTDSISAGSASNVSVIDNSISRALFGIFIDLPTSGLIQGNRVSVTGSVGSTGLFLRSEFDGWIRQNLFSNGETGVRYDAPTRLSDNEITNNEFGLSSTVNSTTHGVGYQLGVLPNSIHGNQTGVALTVGTLQNQHIHHNTRGVSGSGQLVSSDLAHGNLIEENMIGVDVAGRVEFQRISHNAIGIRAANNQLIAHNVIYRNDQGIEVNGKSNVRVVGNTLYTPIGDLVRVTGGSQQVELLNNILWSEDGYDIYVAHDSTQGFHSDYNVLHSSGNGKIGYWTKDFNDILDWQEDIYQFDLHSIGRTAVNPDWSRPRFVNLALDDYRIEDQFARQRRSSPSVDAGSPLTDLALPASYVNLLSNPGFESGLTGWLATPSGSTASTVPPAFEGINYFGGDTNATTTLVQTVDLIDAGFNAAQLDTTDLSVQFGGRVRSKNETVPDSGQLSLTFLDAADMPIGSAIVAEAANLTARWEQIGGSSYLPTGVRKIRFEYQSIRRTGATNDAFLDQAFVRLRPSNQMSDAGAYSATAFDSPQLAHLVLRSPDLYKDWERDKPLSIRWDSYGNASDSPIRIDLYQDTVNGPQFVTSISASTPDDGEFTWIAGNSGIADGTQGLRIQIAHSTNLTVLDRSTETFSIPEINDNFYVNDGSTTGDEFTSAIGNNRSTGKVASAPKPYPTNILRIYTLGANQTLTVDHGNYPLIHPLIIGNAQSVGDDEGFTLRGAVAGTTQFSHANPFTVAPIIDLNDADFMTIQDVSVSGGRQGIHVRNISTDLDLTRVRLVSNTSEGLLIEAGSTADVLNQLVASNNTGNGIRILGTLNTLSNSTISGNLATGLVLNNVGSAAVTGNSISNNLGINSNGVEIVGTQGTPVVFGGSDLSLGLGNRVFNNGRNGVLVNGNAIVAGNIVYGHTASAASGIVSSNGSVTANVIHGNTVGVTNNSSGSGAVSENRIYNNVDAGIVQSNGSSLMNVIYSNGVGARINAGQFRNNLVYDNTMRGASIDGQNVQFVNNTVHQQAGEAVRVQAGQTQLHNNVFWVDGNLGNVAVLVTSNGHTGLASDFNVFHLTNDAGAGQWEGARYGTLTGFQTVSQSNLNSLQTDPLFVNTAGIDGVLGYVNATQDGGDDDFHLQSVHGSFHGGTFAPVATVGGTGVPVGLTGAWVNDALQSPAIDAGNPTDSFFNEPLNNGNAINAGAFGNTAQASRSPAAYLNVINPNGGEIWLKNQTFNVRWTAHNLNAPGVTYTLELLRAGVPVLTIASAAAGTGVFPWLVPDTLIAANDYTIRTTASGVGGLVDESNVAFSIADQITVYYVNDFTVDPGDWTSVPGNDANNGLSPETPKATIQSLLALYDFGPGDRIRVDAGTYALNSDIIISAQDAGVTIEGYNSTAFPTRKTVINRGSLSRPAFDLQNADGLTLEYLEITGASMGVSASLTSDSDDVTIRNVRFIANAIGVSLDSSNDRAAVQNSFFDGGTTFMQRHVVLSGTDGIIELNQFTRGGTGGNSGSGTITASGIRSQIRGNEVYNDQSVSGSIFVGTGFTTEANRVIIRENLVRDMTTNAIFAGTGTLVESNTIRNTTVPTFGTRIAINSSGWVRNNLIHTSDYGLTGTGTFENNRLYNNRRAINAIGGDRYLDNRIYDNTEAIFVNGFNTVLTNNELYRNDLGITLNGTAQLLNNSIVQSIGHAISFTSPSSGGSFINNIFEVVDGNVFQAPNGAVITASDANHFNITGSGNVANFNGGVFADPTAWFYTSGFDKDSFSGDPLFADLDGADDQLGYNRTTFVDYGADDSFVVQSASTTIDAGSPLTPYHREPAPHGTRANIGSTGNTQRATSKLDPQLYVIAPNGLEKVPVGSNTTLRWQSSGLTGSIPAMLVNLGSSTNADNFLADVYRLEGSANVHPVTNTSSVSEPAPAAVYTSAVSTNGGVGTRAIFQLPVNDGTYTMRLHFSSDNFAGIMRDVVVNGVIVASNFDPFVAAGGANRAAVLPLNVTATGGAGLRLELVAKSNNGARIHGLELLSANPSGIANPQVDLQWSTDGTTWTNIATNQPMDRFGRGQFNWSVPNNLPLGDNYRVRALSSGSTPTASDNSDKVFAIVGGGDTFYINDNSAAGDVYTSAIGNDANSGRNPALPMASLEALLRNYDVNPGDTIFVDSGIYNLLGTLTIRSDDSGVRIVGPADRSAIFDRGSTASGTQAFVLNNADGITFENLEIRNSAFGILAGFAQGVGAGSDGLTIRNSRFTNNLQLAVSIEQGNNGVSVIDSDFDGGPTRNQTSHLLLRGTDSSVTGNQFKMSSSDGSRSPAVQILGVRGLVDSNQFVDNRGANLTIFSGGSNPADTTRANNNIVRDSLADGIAANGQFTLVENNQVFNLGVFGNLSHPFAGLRGSGIFRNNLVYNTEVGLLLTGSATGNTIFNSIQAGMWVGGMGTIAENTIYSNPVGILTRDFGGNGSTDDNPLLTGNLVYGNATGVRVEGVSARLVNNTIYQSTGNAIVGSQPIGLHVENNILSVDTGFAISVPNGSPTWSGDYNAFQIRSTGGIASLAAVNFNNLTNWSFAQGTDRNSFVADPLFLDFDGPDNVLGFSGGNFGADDNFRVADSSPTIDRGNPATFFGREPIPNGNRIDLGAYGNTALATSAAPELIQILSPNGLEKLEEGQSVTVRFQSAGLAPERIVAQLSSSNATSQDWSAGAAYRLVGSNNNTTANIDVSGVSNPPPTCRCFKAMQRLLVASLGIHCTTQFRWPMVTTTFGCICSNRTHLFPSGPVDLMFNCKALPSIQTLISERSRALPIKPSPEPSLGSLLPMECLICGCSI